MDRWDYLRYCAVVAPVACGQGAIFASVDVLIAIVPTQLTKVRTFKRPLIMVAIIANKQITYGCELLCARSKVVLMSVQVVHCGSSVYCSLDADQKVVVVPSGAVARPPFTPTKIAKLGFADAPKRCQQTPFGSHTVRRLTSYDSIRY